MGRAVELGRMGATKASLSSLLYGELLKLLLSCDRYSVDN